MSGTVYTGSCSGAENNRLAYLKGKAKHCYEAIPSRFNWELTAIHITKDLAAV